MTRCRPSTKLLTLLMFGLALLGRSSGLSAEDAVPTDRLLPPETYVYITIPSMQSLKERLEQTEFGALLRDEAMADFREEFARVLEEEVAGDVQKALGASLEEVLGMLQGECTLAVTRPAGRDLGGLLFVDVGEVVETRDALLDKLDEALEGQGAERSVDQFDGVEIVTFTRKSPPAAENEKDDDSPPAEDSDPQQVCYFVRDSFVVLSDAPGLLEVVLTRWDGRHREVFADNAAYQAIIAACRDNDDEESSVYFYANPVGLVSEALQSDPSQAMQAMLFSSNLERLGLDRLEGVGGAIDFSTKEFDQVVRTMIRFKPPAAGLLAMLEMPAEPQSPPAWVAADVAEFGAYNWNIAGAYQAASDLYTSFTGQQGGLDIALDQIAEAPQNPGVHPKTDIIDQLTGTFYSVGDEHAELDAESSPMVVAIGIKDDVHLAGVVERLAARGLPMKKREFEGATIYEPDAGAVGATPAMSVRQGFAFVTNEPAAIEKCLRRLQDAPEPLSASEEYRRVAAHFPVRTSSIGYARPSAAVGPAWEFFRSGELDGLLPVKIDLKSLPEYDAVEKYFTLQGSFIEPVENGAMLVQFSLRGD